MSILGLFILLHGMSVSLSFSGHLIRPLAVNDYTTKTIQMSNSQDSKSKFPKEISGPLPVSPDTKVHFGTDRVDNYLKHLRNRGVDAILKTETKIMKYLNNNRRNPITNYYITTDFVLKIQNFLEFLKSNHGDGSAHPIGEEFMILNMLEKTCEVLYEQQWLLVNTTSIHPTKRFIDNVQQISTIINNQIQYWKKTEMQYVCNMYQICKPYPSLSNYLEHGIIALLRLPDFNLDIFMQTLKKKVERNNDFLELVGGVKGKEITFKKMEKLCNKTSMKDSLTSLRVIVSRRFKVSKSASSAVAPATQVLLDIVDKALLFKHDTHIVRNLEGVLRNIQEWGNLEAELDESLLEKVVNDIFKTIKAIKNPVKRTLIQIITKGH